MLTKKRKKATDERHIQTERSAEGEHQSSGRAEKEAVRLPRDIYESERGRNQRNGTGEREKNRE